MSKLLILGANPETSVLVKKAQAMGITVGVTDNNPLAYAKKVSDFHYDIDGMDTEAIVKKVKEDNIDGVIVGTADPLIRPYNVVCREAGLPRYTTDAAVDALTNKRNFKNVCRQFGIKGVPEYTLEQILNDDGVQYPVLVKPEDGRSGKGISICFEKAEIGAAIDKAKSQSQTGNVLFERFMSCDDVFMYYTFVDGHYLLSAMADRFTNRSDKGLDPVVLGATYPSKYYDLYMATMHDNMCRMFEHLSIKNGVFLVQAFVENGNIMVYDPGFRLQGGAPHILLEAINGIDQQKLLIDTAMGRNPGAEDIIEKNDAFFRGKIAGSQTVLLREGTIGRIEGIEEIDAMQQIVCTTQRLSVGECVDMVGTEQQILVRFHIVCDSKEEYRDVVRAINDKVVAYDDKGHRMNVKAFEPEWVI